MNANLDLDDLIRFPEDGFTLKNRLVKAAMVEGLSSLRTGQPNESHYRLYKRWADAGFGMIISGNVCIANDHLGTPGDLRLPREITELTLQPWRRLAQSMTCNSAIGILQLVHTGRQSARCAGRLPFRRPLAPSSVRVTTNPTGYTSRIVEKAAFQEPIEMTLDDIDRVIALFIDGAELAHRAGFHGVQLHASHGYLLSSFLSPKTNIRKDHYGGTPENRLRIIIRIIDGIRQKWKRPFVLGIKLNSTDFVEGGLDEEEALQHVATLVQHGGLDFIEISGGSYEYLAFLTGEEKSPKAAKTQHREAIFAAFSSRAKQVAMNAIQQSASGKSPPLIMCTGGFRSRYGIEQALREDGIDLIGIGRAAAADPHWIERLLRHSPKHPQTKIMPELQSCVDYQVSGGTWLKTAIPLKLVGGGLATLWHELQMARLGRGAETRVAWSFERLLLVEFLQSDVPKFMCMMIFAMALAIYVRH